VPPLIDDCSMLKTITLRLHPPRPVVPYTTSNPVKSSSTLHVLTSANLVPCPHQPLAAWEMIKEQFTAFCLSLLPWLGPLVYRDGVTPPLNPGRPPERAGESTRTPLISPEKLALPRPARGAPLASSLAGFFRETGGQWGPHPRTSPCAPVWPTASAYGFFLPPRRDLDFDLLGWTFCKQNKKDGLLSLELGAKKFHEQRAT
jgi:hypothetical protein